MAVETTVLEQAIDREKVESRCHHASRGREFNAGADSATVSFRLWIPSERIEKTSEPQRSSMENKLRLREGVSDQDENCGVHDESHRCRTSLCNVPTKSSMFRHKSLFFCVCAAILVIQEAKAEFLTRDAFMSKTVKEHNFHKTYDEHISFNPTAAPTSSPEPTDDTSSKSTNAITPSPTDGPTDPPSPSTSDALDDDTSAKPTSANATIDAASPSSTDSLDDDISAPESEATTPSNTTTAAPTQAPTQAASEQSVQNGDTQPSVPSSSSDLTVRGLSIMSLLVAIAALAIVVKKTREPQVNQEEVNSESKEEDDEEETVVDVHSHSEIVVAV
ncbi:hypothetical protein AC1031_009998 [Aphanomyces cochlioides]|nr:hypothetical protein AC1031_009998 [Aphanomyces cochlioides]